MITIQFNVISILLLVVFTVLMLFIIQNRNIKFKVKILRLTLILLCVIFTLKIGYKISQDANILNLIMLIDTSYSMKFNQRMQKINKFINQWYKELTKKYNVEIYQFNEEIYKIHISSHIVYSPKGTAIHNAIDKLLSLLRTPSLIFLFSDGINNSKTLPVVKNEYAKIIPVTFYEPDFKDISILDVKYSRLGFKDVEHEIGVEVLSNGYDNIDISVRVLNLETKEFVKEKTLKIKE
ncbi:MAG: VWA domain-containing protein, partial [Endomicrobia bacterium]|nr:VWA domain-containing protein [Endomicrobiia bacterium]